MESALRMLNGAYVVRKDVRLRLYRDRLTRAPIYHLRVRRRDYLSVSAHAVCGKHATTRSEEFQIRKGSHIHLGHLEVQMQCGEENRSDFFFRMIGQRIVEYFVFWHRFRTLMRLKLTDELRRKPTSEELFERCAFLFAHWKNLRAHRRRRRTDGPCVRCPHRENVLIHCAPQNLCILV